MTRFDGSFEPIAASIRSDFEESHAGAVIDLTGNLAAQIRNPDLVVYPRSSP